MSTEAKAESLGVHLVGSVPLDDTTSASATIPTSPIPIPRSGPLMNAPPSMRACREPPPTSSAAPWSAWRMRWRNRNSMHRCFYRCTTNWFSKFPRTKCRARWANFCCRYPPVTMMQHSPPMPRSAQCVTRALFLKASNFRSRCQRRPTSWCWLRVNMPRVSNLCTQKRCSLR